MLKNITYSQIIILRFGGFEKQLKPQDIIEVPAEFEAELAEQFKGYIEIEIVPKQPDPPPQVAPEIKQTPEEAKPDKKDVKPKVNHANKRNKG